LGRVLADPSILIQNASSCQQGHYFSPIIGILEGLQTSVIDFIFNAALLAVREFGITVTTLARKLRSSQAVVNVSVKGNQKIVRVNGLELLGRQNL
jgi:hypothetical protein